ncbi:MAG: HAMP domain-containing sensor histidine kinase, partial [Phycisphaerae bacterium]
LLFCAHLERAATELREKNHRLREKTALLEANRRKLLELDHLKSDFVAMVSHELRTPLTSIIGFAHTLRTLPLGAEQHQKYLGIIESEGKRLAEMVEEYLDVSKIESGTFALRLTPIDVQRLTQEVADPVRLDSHVRIEVRIDPTVPVVAGDAPRLKRVLRNLLDNAVRYTAEGTAVDVSTSASGDGLSFSVRDYGPGLTKHSQERVFERFYRGTDGITERTHGSGLGLAIARAIVEKHGGRIWVESEPGHGATFRFWLPLHPVSTATTPTAAKSDVLPPATNRFPAGTFAAPALPPASTISPRVQIGDHRT